MTPPPATELTGIAMSPADHTTLARWAVLRGYRVEIALDHERYEELAEVYGTEGSGYHGTREASAGVPPMTGLDREGIAAGTWGGVLTFMAYREASTGQAVVHDHRGREVGRAGDMAGALAGLPGR